MYLLAVLIRIYLPLSILRWPLFGAVLALLLDGADWHAVNGKYYDAYPYLDKALDLYYMGLEVYVALHWKDYLAKITASYLYIYRGFGVIIFFLTQNNIFLILFPNVFENFFIFCLLTQKISGKKKIFSKKSLIISLIIISIPKLFQEFSIHYLKPNSWDLIKLYGGGVTFTYDHIYHQMLILIILSFILSYLVSRTSKNT